MTFGGTPLACAPAKNCALNCCGFLRACGPAAPQLLGLSRREPARSRALQHLFLEDHHPGFRQCGLSRGGRSAPTLPRAQRAHDVVAVAGADQRDLHRQIGTAGAGSCAPTPPARLSTEHAMVSPGTAYRSPGSSKSAVQPGVPVIEPRCTRVLDGREHSQAQIHLDVPRVFQPLVHASIRPACAVPGGSAY